MTASSADRPDVTLAKAKVLSAWTKAPTDLYALGTAVRPLTEDALVRALGYADARALLTAELPQVKTDELLRANLYERLIDDGKLDRPDGDPGDLIVEVPNNLGGTDAQLFSDSSLEELKGALDRLLGTKPQPPAPSEPTPQPPVSTQPAPGPAPAPPAPAPSPQPPVSTQPAPAPVPAPQPPAPAPAPLPPVSTQPAPAPGPAPHPPAPPQPAPVPLPPVSSQPSPSPVPAPAPLPPDSTQPAPPPASAPAGRRRVPPLVIAGAVLALILAARALYLSRPAEPPPAPPPFPTAEVQPAPAPASPAPPPAHRPAARPHPATPPPPLAAPEPLPAPRPPVEDDKNDMPIEEFKKIQREQGPTTHPVE